MPHKGICRLVGKEDVSTTGDDIPVQGVNTDGALATCEHQLPHQLTRLVNVDVAQLNRFIIDRFAEDAPDIAITEVCDTDVHVDFVTHVLVLTFFIAFRLSIY